MIIIVVVVVIVIVMIVTIIIVIISVIGDDFSTPNLSLFLKPQTSNRNLTVMMTAKEAMRVMAVVTGTPNGSSS